MHIRRAEVQQNGLLSGFAAQHKLQFLALCSGVLHEKSSGTGIKPYQGQMKFGTLSAVHCSSVEVWR